MQRTPNADRSQTPYGAHVEVRDSHGFTHTGTVVSNNPGNFQVHVPASSTSSSTVVTVQRAGATVHQAR